MADRFGIPEVTEYIEQMGVKIARVDHEHEIIEIAFYGEHGQWRMAIGFHQTGETRKMMLLVPHIGTITEKKRLECLEALMAVNYRIALGKFGLDLEDGEVRLEEVIPLANDTITFEQFRLAFEAILQVSVIYQSLLQRIVFGDLTANEALDKCEQDFLESSSTQELINGEEPPPADTPPDLNVEEVMEEVNRLFEGHKE